MNTSHRYWGHALLLGATVFCLSGAQAQNSSTQKKSSLTAAQRMSQTGPQETSLKGRTGTWDVVFTMWPHPGAKPLISRGIVAQRQMIGSILQETMHPAPGSKMPAFTRLDYLNFDRVEGRWKYVSMDTRFPVSIMPAHSLVSTDTNKILVQFDPLGFVGMGSEVEGRFMVSDMEISHTDNNHELKQQHVLMANGTGQSWLFVQYQYTRRTSK